jgi:hypothetical protein
VVVTAVEVARASRRAASAATSAGRRPALASSFIEAPSLANDPKRDPLRQRLRPARPDQDVGDVRS